MVEGALPDCASRNSYGLYGVHGHSLVQDVAAFVEKTGYNVEHLKATVSRILRERADGTVGVSSAGQFVPLGGGKS